MASTPATVETLVVIEEVKSATFGKFSINETAIGVFTLTGPGLDDLGEEDRDDLHTMLSFWKYGAEHHGQPLSEEEILGARAWFAQHRGE